MADDKLDDEIFVRQKARALKTVKIAVGVAVALILMTLYILLRDEL